MARKRTKPSSLSIVEFDDSGSEQSERKHTKRNILEYESVRVTSDQKRTKNNMPSSSAAVSALLSLKELVDPICMARSSSSFTATTTFPLEVDYPAAAAMEVTSVTASVPVLYSNGISAVNFISDEDDKKFVPCNARNYYTCSPRSPISSRRRHVGRVSDGVRQRPNLPRHGRPLPAPPVLYRFVPPNRK